MDISRQTEVFVPTDYEKPIHIIGCGATGSWVALGLAKMGVRNIHLIDMDQVEEHNIPNQFFTVDDLGRWKAEALSERIRKESGYTENEQKITYDIERVTAENAAELIDEGIVFCLVDTMSGREEILEGLQYNLNIDLFIDTRMGIDFMRIYAINPSNCDHINFYKKTLCSDDNSSESFCGVSQSIVATAQMVSSFAIWYFIQFVQNKTTIGLKNETIFCIRPLSYLQTEWNDAPQDNNLFE